MQRLASRDDAGRPRRSRATTHIGGEKAVIGPAVARHRPELRRWSVIDERDRAEGVGGQALLSVLPSTEMRWDSAIYDARIGRRRCLRYSSMVAIALGRALQSVHESVYGS